MRINIGGVVRGSGSGSGPRFSRCPNIDHTSDTLKCRVFLAQLTGHA